MEHYEADTNQMNVLQLFSFIVHEWIKSTFRLCLAQEKLLIYMVSDNTLSGTI